MQAVTGHGRGQAVLLWWARWHKVRRRDGTMARWRGVAVESRLGHAREERVRWRRLARSWARGGGWKTEAKSAWDYMVASVID